MAKMTASAVVATVLIACGCGVLDSGTLWESGPFRISWIDSPSSVRLGLDMGGGSSLRIIDPCVFAVGENERYLVVKQIPNVMATANVYVLEKSQYAALKGAMPPLPQALDENAFASQATQRGLPPVRELFERSRCQRQGA